MYSCLNAFTKIKIKKHIYKTLYEWEIVHELNGKSDAKGKQKMKNLAELLKEWRNYFKNLLNVEQTVKTHEIDPAESDLNINTGPISLDEVQKAVESLKNDKSPGCD